ncbi:MAG: Gfo/Idh/MocA family oxidoreductase [Humidesulfovibrio sp.]|uniref:Gfo/Idh/MocA family protein n=1 Tax=Humidesulfovibrio sp. TaxID=2910988 RepID=UPI0027EAFE37|nr:Gfo/Idh/MocA family oxidoreductase [Humidesulfovibrio sp.]MDQ7836211.1 Gfo/Idh/MocA family oxidoreductase [Humidesulfovibrio sp.]
MTIDTSRPVKVGLIGAGLIARQHLTAMSRVPGLEAVGIASRTRAKAEALAAEFGLLHVCDSPGELVRQAAPDALMVLVSPQAMAPLALECLDFGLPLFLEKPVGLSVEEAESVAGAAAEKNVPNMVGFNRRHYSIFQKGLAKVLERGRLLSVIVEGSERMHVARATGRFTDEVLRAWVFANATHTIDLLRHFGGEPEEVCAFATSLHEPLGDQFVAALRFPGGVLGSFTGNWHSPGGWGVVLKGEGVTAEFRPLETCRLTYADGTSETLEPDADDAAVKPGFCGQQRAFVDMVRTGALAAPSLDLGGALLTMRLAGRLIAPVRPLS